MNFFIRTHTTGTLHRNATLRPPTYLGDLYPGKTPRAMKAMLAVFVAVCAALLLCWSK